MFVLLELQGKWTSNIIIITYEHLSTKEDNKSQSLEAVVWMSTPTPFWMGLKPLENNKCSDKESSTHTTWIRWLKLPTPTVLNKIQFALDLNLFLQSLTIV